MTDPDRPWNTTSADAKKMFRELFKDPDYRRMVLQNLPPEEQAAVIAYGEGTD